MRMFASDNASGVHPQVLDAMAAANRDHAVSYGDDIHTKKALELFREMFGEEVMTWFVFTGTAANTLSIQSVCRSWQAVICAETAHMQVDECGAPEKITGCKLLNVPSHDGKIHIEDIHHHLTEVGFEHHVQPRVISITQPTELGTLYQLDEIQAISRFAHENNLLLHMDGARISNAAAALGCSFHEMTSDRGVDILSFGGTKNGMMYGEAIVFFPPYTSEDFKYVRKQAMQLASKMRFISSQFMALFGGELWKQNALNANRMARYLADKAAKIENVRITRPVDVNAVFARIPRESIEALQRETFFYVWDEAASEVRWMTSWDTTESDIDRFVETLEIIIPR